MDSCLVCWEQNNNTVSSRIYLKLRVWKEYNVQQIIEKHLSWWHLRQPKNKDIEPWICLQCWQEILSFHKFYERVEDINSNLPHLKKLKNSSNIAHELEDSVMDDSMDSDSEDFKSAKRRKTIVKKERSESKLEEFTIVDVRTDSNVYAPETVMEDPFHETSNNKGNQTHMVTLDLAEFKQELKGFITTEMKSLRRSIHYDLKGLEEKLAPLMVLSSAEEASNAKRISEFRDMLNIHEPFNDLQSFCEFENKLRFDKDCVDALRELINLKVRTAKNLTDAISAVISMVITPELQTKFSACGKPNKGVAKENFSATKIYSELKDYLLIQFASESEASVLSKTSRWLAASKDRTIMGRKSMSLI